ncbi:MAG: hypothetical protein ACOC10_04675 [Bacteroidota bacterium]
MKNLKVISVFIACFFIATVYVSAVETSKKIRNYEIEAVENIQLGENAEKVWNLTYEGSENSILVTKRSNLDGTFYIVNSEYFEVSYLASSKGFGVRPVKKAWSNVPRQINSVILNTEELKRQKTLTPGNVDDEKALGLIASYLPDLINDQYVHLLN